MTEVVITLMVVAIGLLGANAMQLAATRFQITAVHRAAAVQHSLALIEKMRVNSAALQRPTPVPLAADLPGLYLMADAYADATGLPDGPACGLNGQAPCSPQDIARDDVREWRENLATGLPGGRGSIFPLNTQAGAIGPGRLVVVMWREKPELAYDDKGTFAGTGALDLRCPEPREAGIRCFSLPAIP